MRRAAASGPIVVINMSVYSCDAIIIKTDEIKRMPLPVILSDIEAMTRPVPNIYSVENDVLEWLWDKITGPVLDTLGFTDCPPDDSYSSWPRVWWVLTGSLARLPLHAAGYHGVKGSETAMDCVISSYSVSITTLVQAHDSHSKHGHSKHADCRLEKAVLIGMTELTNAPEEVRRVASICQSMQVKMPEPHATDVLEALKDCDIFHFAGHGSSNSFDPSRSAMKLANTDLTVSSLLNINLHKIRPFLAFLSACSTGQVKEDFLMDEGLHLIGAFQVAGFWHVIGTL